MAKSSKEVNGVAAINGRGDVWIFVNERAAPYAKLRFEDEMIVVVDSKGGTFSRTYTAPVNTALRRLTKATVALVDGAGQVLELDEVVVEPEGITA